MSELPMLVGERGVITACLRQEDEKLYHRRAGEYLSSHQLRDFRRCPDLFLRKREGLVSEPDRPAYLVGRALHCLVIEGRAEFDRRFLVGGPINKSTGKPYGADTKAHREWAAQQDRDVLSEEQAVLVERMYAGVASHTAASALFVGGVGEGVARCDYGGRPCQIRIDYLHPHYGLIDLKTCDDLDWFESDARKYGYMHQLSFYRGVLAAMAGMMPDDIPCRLVAVEKSQPFRCGVWRYAPALLDDCELENLKAIAELGHCEEHGYWPTRYEEERTVYV